MKSFPSSFSKDALVQTSGFASGNIKQTLKNMANSIIQQSLHGSSGPSKPSDLGEYIEWTEYDYFDSMEQMSNTNKLINNIATTQLLYTKEGISSSGGDLTGDEDIINGTKNHPYFENPLKLPGTVLNAINKYKRYLKTTGAFNKKGNLVKKGDDGKESKKQLMERTDTVIAQSLINPWFGVPVKGVTHHIPLYVPQHDIGMTGENVDLNKIGQTQVTANTKIDPQKNSLVTNVDESTNETTTKDLKEAGFVEQTVSLNNFNPDITDCSIKTLVDLSGGYGADPSKYKTGAADKKNSLGRNVFRYADFMFCKDLGKVSNNHLIVLRKFPGPIGDNIFKLDANNIRFSAQPDKGRLVAWFGTEDNKLEDICKYNYNATWKHLEATIEDIQSKEDNTKLLPSLINLANPNYWGAVSSGIAGSQNSPLNWFSGKSGFLESKGSYENSFGDLYHMDTNKIYSPYNSVQETNIYEGKLVFNQEFNLKFSYKLRAYDGINPRTAMLDLLGNILEVTYKRGIFWGGRRRFLGAPRNNAGWKKANDMLDKLQSGVGESLEDLFGCTSWGDMGSWFKNIIGKIGDFASDAMAKGAEMAENIKNGDTSSLGLAGKGKMIAGGLVGMLKNKLGRPAVYAMNSLLDGGAHGFWHLTIGNPRNPIMSMGNLIMSNAVVQHSGPLGIDDFPTELSVTVTLKHGKPRDLTEISQMYTCGLNGIYQPLDEQKFKDYFSIGKDVLYDTTTKKYTVDVPVESEKKDGDGEKSDKKDAKPKTQKQDMTESYQTASNANILPPNVGERKMWAPDMAEIIHPTEKISNEMIDFLHRNAANI